MNSQLNQKTKAVAEWTWEIQIDVSKPSQPTVDHPLSDKLFLHIA